VRTRVPDVPEVLDALTLTGAELAALGGLSEVAAGFAHWYRGATDALWPFIVDGLVARGLLDVVDRHYALAPAAEPVLAPLIAADRLTSISAMRGDGSAALMWIRSGSLIVEHAPREDGLHELRLVDDSQLAAFQTFVPDIVGDAHGRAEAAVEIPRDALLAALAEPDAPSSAIPEGYREALRHGGVACAFDDWHGDEVSSVHWLDSGSRGCWLIEHLAESVLVTRLARPDLRDQLRQQIR
jgi:hypothetical protein